MMAAKLVIWEACLNCGSRDIIEMHGHKESLDVIDEMWDACKYSHVCRHIVDQQPLGGDE